MKSEDLFNISTLLSTQVRIHEIDPLSSEAIWPKNIEICITRVPIRKRDGYSPEMFKKFAEKLKQHMVPNGVAFLICYSPMEAKARPFEISQEMTNAGFNHVDNIIIEKSWFPGKRSETNLVNSHEYVLHFCNGDVWRLDRLPIRQYLNTHDSISCPGNLWRINTGSLDESYPLDLAELLIKMTDILPGSMLFDPWMGTTSSLKAALKLGHSFHGFEIDNKQHKKYDKIIENFKKNGVIE